jgi:hypothetical protein
MKNKKTILLLFLFGFVMGACNSQTPLPEATAVPPTAKVIPVTVEVTRLVTQEVVVTATAEPLPLPTETPYMADAAQSLEATAGQGVISALRSGDMGALSQYMDPDGTLEFTALDLLPFSPTSPAQSVFNQKQVETLLKDKTRYNWMVFEGPEELTFAEYFSTYIFDLDYSDADRVLYNDEVGLGYEDQVLPQVSDNLILLEYVMDPPRILGGKPYFSEGLILVFELRSDWYLTRVWHDGWTP